MATKTWTQTSGNLASTDANWSGGMKPVAGDDIVFDATSTANCTWDLALALGSFSMNAGYTGTVTQVASFSVTSYSQATGIFTGSVSYTLTDSGDFVYSAGTITDGALALTLSGTSKILALKDPASWTIRILNITGSITSTSGPVSIANFYNTGTLSISTGKHLQFDPNTGRVFNNNGIINGPGAFWIFLYSSYTADPISFGTINAPVVIFGHVADKTLTLASNAILSSSLTLDGTVGTGVITLDLSTSNYALSATDITIGTRGILNGRGSVITCNGTFDSSAGAFTQGTSTLICATTGNLKCATDGVYNLRVASGVTTTLTAALNVYKDLRNNGTLTRGANTVSLLGAGEQTVSGYPDTAITVNSTGPVIFHECLHHVADVTFTAGTCVWTGASQYITRGNLSISAISRKPHPGANVRNVNGTLTFNTESRMGDLVTDVGCTTVQSAGVMLGISGKILTAGTFTRNTPAKIIRDKEQATLVPFPVNLPVNQPVGWGDT